MKADLEVVSPMDDLPIFLRRRREDAAVRVADLVAAFDRPRRERQNHRSTNLKFGQNFIGFFQTTFIKAHSFFMI